MSVAKDKKQGVGARNSFVVMHTSECLKVDKTKINFCKYPVFASSWKQIVFNVELQDYFIEAQRKEYHLLRVKAITHAPYDSVFVVKGLEHGEDTTEVEIPLFAGQSIQLFVKVNMPQLSCTTDLSGTLTLAIDDLKPIVMSILSRGEVPQIMCLKQMEQVHSSTRIIKIPSKGVMKIPFKNCSNINFFFEVKLVGKDLQHPDSDGVRVYPIQNNGGVKGFEDAKNVVRDSVIKVDANSAFCITLMLELLKKDLKLRVARRILALQVQGTKLLFLFPLQLILSD